MPDAEVTITMKKTEALALARIAETGLRVAEALNLIQSTGAAERAIAAVNAAVAGRK